MGFAATRPLGDARSQLIRFHDRPAQRAIAAEHELALLLGLGLGDEQVDDLVPERLAAAVDRQQLMAPAAGR